MEKVRTDLQEQYLQQNTARMNVDRTLQQKNESESVFEGLKNESQDIEEQLTDIKKGKERTEEEIKEAEVREEEIKADEAVRCICTIYDDTGHIDDYRVTVYQ